MRTPDSPENYNAFKDSQRQQSEKRQQFRVVTRLSGDDSSPVSDEQLANDVAKQTGSAPAPEDIVRANRELFREASDRAWVEKIGKEAPITLAMLSDPNGKPISKGDAEAFASIEQTLSNVGRVPSAPSGGLPLRGVQLASALVSASGSRGNSALPPLPLPDPRKAPPTPLPDPRDSVPIPLPNPARSAPVLPPSQGQDGTTASASGAPTAAPVEKGAAASLSVEGAGAQPSGSADAVGAPGATYSEGAADAPSDEGADQSYVFTGAGAQTGGARNSVGAPGAGSAQSVPMAPLPPDAAGQGAATTSPAEQVNPGINTAGELETTPVETTPAARRAPGQAAASETEGGQGPGLDAVGGATLGPNKATPLAPLTTEDAERGASSTSLGQTPSSATGGTAQDIGQPGAAMSEGQVGAEAGQLASVTETDPNEFLYIDIAYAKSKSPQKQQEIRDNINKLDTLKASFLMGQYEAALNGVDPAKLLENMSAAYRELSALVESVGLQAPSRPKYYGNAVARVFWKLLQSIEYGNAENATQIGLDQKRTFWGILADEWSYAPGGRREAAWGAMVPVDRNSFVQRMSEAQERVNRSLVYDLSAISNNGAMLDGFEQSQISQDPADLYAGLVTTNFLSAVGRWAHSRFDTFLGSDQLKVAAEHWADAGKSQVRIEALPMSPEAIRFEAAMKKFGEESLAVQLSKLPDLIESDPEGVVAYLTEKGTEAVPILLVSAIATAVTKKPVLGTALSTVYAYKMEKASAALDSIINDKGFDLTRPEDVVRLINTPDVLREAERLGGRRALLAALTEAATGGLGAKTLLKNPVLDEIAKQVSSPILAMGGETLAELYSGQKLNAANIVMSGAVEFVQGTMTVGIDAGVGMVAKKLTKAQAGGHDYIALQKMIKDAEVSVLRAKDPEAYSSTIRALVRGKPSEKIFIRARELNYILTRPGSDPNTLWSGLKGVTRADFEAAFQAGGDIQIPTEIYLTYVAHTPIGVALTPFARFGGDSVSGAEAQAFSEQLKEMLQGGTRSVAGEPVGGNPASAPPKGTGGEASGDEGGARKVPDTTPSGPSGTTSEGYNQPVVGARTVGSEAKAVPNQPQTLPVYGREFLDSVSPGTLIGPYTRGTQPEVLPEHPSSNPDTAQKVYGPFKSRSSKGHVDRPPTEPTPGSDRGAAPH